MPWPAGYFQKPKWTRLRLPLTALRPAVPSLATLTRSPPISQTATRSSSTRASTIRIGSTMPRRYLIHPGVMTCLRSLMGDEVLAAQSMFYFKPPGARGQAMHQDNFYLMVEPQTCVAAWTAIDDSDPDNGGMYLVEETANEEIACPGTADPAVSFTTHLVPIPQGKKAVPCIMRAGDTLFFNGSMIHGSEPNRSKDRFRRAFICHYVPRSTVRISKFYLPLLAPDGEEVMLEPNTGGG